MQLSALWLKIVHKGNGTGRARNAPKNDGLLNVVNLLPRPRPRRRLLPLPLASSPSQDLRSYSNFKRQNVRKKKEKKQERNLEKKEVKQTQTRSGRRSFAARQPPLWPSQARSGQQSTQNPKTEPNRHQNRTETEPKTDRASAIWLYCARCLNIYEVLQYL